MSDLVLTIMLLEVLYVIGVQGYLPKHAHNTMVWYQGTREYIPN